MRILYTNEGVCDVIATDEETVQFFKEHERLCDCCRYYMDGCTGGIVSGLDGPRFPPCTDIDPIKVPSRFLKHDATKLMAQIITEEGGTTQ